MCFLPLHKMPQSETKESIATNGNDVDDLESFERPRQFSVGILTCTPFLNQVNL